MESLKLTEKMITLIHMIEGQERSIEKHQSLDAPNEVLRSMEYMLKEMQSELSELICEAYRHEVRV